MKTPVAFIIFKRPYTTEKVFEAIRQAKPPKLFVIADGPRRNHLGEAEQCQSARDIIQRVDWECEVYKNYSDVNLGCGKRLPTGLDWVFSHVEEAIILEDDCLPNSTFFSFCEELLEKYRYDERIASISGQNVQFGRQRTNYSYYFSKYNHVWGWATWRRAWQSFDFNMALWPEIKQREFLRDILGNDEAAKAWARVLQDTYDKRLNTVWDFQWQFACWVNNRLSILSNTNLISNIGFGAGSTNVSNSKSKHATISTNKIEFPLEHPPFMICDAQSDNFTQNTLFSHLNPNIFQRFIFRIQAELDSIEISKKLYLKN